jgi:hypothetical protein
MGACKQDMAVCIAQIVHNFGHELSSWNQKLANSIVPGLQYSYEKGELMRAAEGGQQDGGTSPISKPSLYSTDFVCGLCGMGDLQNFIHFLKLSPNMTFCRSACYGRSFANDKTSFSGLHHLNYDRLL